MIIALIYMSVGMLIGMLFKYELDNRRMKKRIVKKIACARAIKSSPKMEKYDTILYSIRELNENLVLNENYTKKEVQ